MEIKREKNKYGWFKVSCPFCGKECFSRDKSPLGGIRNHILGEAKKEAFALALSNSISASTGQTPHLEYYKEHTSDQPVTKVLKRQFDDDITLK